MSREPRSMIVVIVYIPWLFPTYRRFPMPLQQTAIEIILEKGEIVRNEQLLPFPQCFQLYSIMILSLIQIIHICCMWERVNPFPHTTILQQTTEHIVKKITYFVKKIENLHNWMDNLWQEVENIVAKGDIARFVQRRQKASIWGKGVRIT